MSRIERLPGEEPEGAGTEFGGKDRRPHVLLVVDGFPRALGGGERIVLKIAAMLPRYGYRVSILTFAVDAGSPVVSSPPACPMYLLPMKRTYGVDAGRAAAALGRFLRDEEVRIVQTFFESSDLWAGAVVKVFSDAKLIWSRRDMGILRERKHRLAYRAMAALPDRVFAVSDEVARYTVAVDGVEAGRVETIHNGLDVVESGDVGRDDGGMVVTTVGNIRRVKGHDVLLRAAAVVCERMPEVSFTVAGEVLETNYFAELEELIAKLGLAGPFRFVGGVSKLAEHLRTADVFVLPSRSEGFSNAIIEAMAAGLPVVATRVGGNAEAVEEGVSGWIVPPDDVGALAVAMLRVLGDPAGARAMGLAGTQRVRERFTTEAMMGRIVAAYADLLR